MLLTKGTPLHVTFMDDTNTETWYPCTINIKKKNKWNVIWEDGSSSSIVLLQENFRNHMTNLAIDNHPTRIHPLWTSRAFVFVTIEKKQVIKVNFNMPISKIIIKLNKVIKERKLTSLNLVSCIHIYDLCNKKICSLFADDHRLMSDFITLNDLYDVNQTHKGVYVVLE